MIETLKQQPENALKFRATVLQRMLSPMAPNAAKAIEIKEEYIATLEQITPTSLPTWEAFCPATAFDLKRTTLDEAKQSGPQRLDQLQSLIREAMEHLDYTKANQTYIAARDTAVQWVKSAEEVSTERTALERLRHSQLSHIEMTKSSGLAYFEAAALFDYLGFLSIRDRDYASVLEQVDRFVHEHPIFSIPNSLERLYDHAMHAASCLGMTDKHSQAREAYNRWINKCSFMAGGGGVSDETISNPDFAMREMYSTGDTLIEWGIGALRLMLLWAGYEYSEGLISADYLTALFAPSIESLPSNEVMEYLKDIDAEELSEFAFGSTERPRSSSAFMDQYHRLLTWVIVPDRPPSLKSRLHALEVFLQSRQFRVRQWLAHRSRPPGVNIWTSEESIDYETETAALKELERLKNVGHDDKTISERNTMSDIHIAISKSFVLGAPLVDDAELQARSVQCRGLISTYHDSGRDFNEYIALTALMRILQQRYMLFRSVTPESVIEIGNEAEAAFVRTRNSIGSLDPASSLVARVKLSHDFTHREHYNLALAASWRGCADKLAQNTKTPSVELQNLAFGSLLTFLNWTLRSKGRGFADLTAPETAISRAAKVVEIARTRRLQTDPRDDLRSVTSPLSNLAISTDDPAKGSAISKQQFDEMLQHLPDGLVIVDFIEVRYGNDNEQLMAMVYRKGQPMSLPLHLQRVNMTKVANWVLRNLGSTRLRTKPLAETGFSALEELKDLVEPLARAIKLGETVVFCPTGDLIRVPIHAVPLEGAPLIERNPVLYCQSLSILYWLWQKSRVAQPLRHPSKVTVVNPMPDTWEDGSPVKSIESVQELVNMLNGKLHAGFELRSADIARAVEASTVFHYHGHVHFNANNALESAMILNQKAFKTTQFVTRQPGAEMLSARQLFGVKLGDNSLACIMGCSSGVSAVSSTDDVLGIQTALFYAGASAVVSTLWPVEDSDAAAFAKAFYEVLYNQPSAAQGSVEDGEANQILVSGLNVASALQKAALTLRHDPGTGSALDPYHWAAFTLNGLWDIPGDLFLQAAQS